MGKQQTVPTRSPEPALRRCAPPRALAWWERGKNGRPKPRACAEGDSGDTEDHGQVWALCWPELVWHVPVSWLFSFVTGKGQQGWPGPGDLWGVDEDGELLIVEAKKTTRLMRSSAIRPASDPFEDFLGARSDDRGVAFHQDARRVVDGAFGRTTEPDALAALYGQRLDAERRYIETYGPAYATGVLPPDHGGHPDAKTSTFIGVAPYSCKRRILFRWPHLYREFIMPGVMDPRAWEHDARRRLDVRRSRGSPPPHYIGLLTLKARDPASVSGWRCHARERLAAAVGSDHVHLRAVQGKPCDIAPGFEISNPVLA